MTNIARLELTHQFKVTDDKEGWPGINEMCEQPGSGIIPNPGGENEAGSHNGDDGNLDYINGIVERNAMIQRTYWIYVKNYFPTYIIFYFLKIEYM